MLKLFDIPQSFAAWIGLARESQRIPGVLGKGDGISQIE